MVAEWTEASLRPVFMVVTKSKSFSGALNWVKIGILPTIFVIYGLCIELGIDYENKRKSIQFSVRLKVSDLVTTINTDLK